jgi:hypothetical protein
MPIAMCTWCSRSRLVELHTWKSPRTGEQICGEVCGHCYYGTGRADDCRTCKLKAERAAAAGMTGVRRMSDADVLEMFRQMGSRRHRG